jgi:hypothetical protein
VDVEHALMLRLSTECCVKRAHPQHVEVVAIRKIASVVRERLSGNRCLLREQWYGCN